MEPCYYLTSFPLKKRSISNPPSEKNDGPPALSSWEIPTSSYNRLCSSLPFTTENEYRVHTVHSKRALPTYE
jgi:hypothetical protein